MEVDATPTVTTTTSPEKTMKQGDIIDSKASSDTVGDPLNAQVSTVAEVKEVLNKDASLSNDSSAQGAGDSVTVPCTTESSQPENSELKKQDDFVIFHRVSYLGAAMIKEPRSEPEIQKIMAFLNDQSSDKVMTVSVSVDIHADGFVIVYEGDNQLEISRFKINQIIFFARGSSGTSAAACFAFTSSHGESYEEAIFQCHSFRCDVPDAVGRVFSSFARAFESTKKRIENNIVESQENFVFEVSLEIKEDDGKGHYGPAPRDKGFFKIRSCVPKQIWLTIYQIPDTARELNVERCFGLLLSPGRHVRNSDMQLVETISWSIGSTNYGRRSYVVGGVWDTNDPAFESLNQETAKDSGVFLTVAVDLVIKGIQEPIRFALENKARVYPSTERFWMLGRKYHFTQQFEITLKKIDANTPKNGNSYQVNSTRALGEVDKSKVNFNLNFTSFIRSSSIGSLDLDTPTKEDEESDDDEPLQSGMGEISKDCTDEQISAWSEIVANWPIGTPRPKHLTPLVKAGIPDTIRGEMWLRLADCQDDSVLFETYKTLLGKECDNEEVILRDITRTFPANDYFKESGGKGQEQLHRISKGYAVYDTEVGYCQGISFIGAAMLLQMPEEQAFCLLVKLMYNYQFRDLYRDGFDNLHLKLHQLDRLIEEQIPELWAHFQELAIESHMYASQWFLTLYTAKFPLVFVFRVIDLFLLDGTKTLFQVALALLAAARKDLLVLDFEGVLKYFRVSLPKKFKTAESANALIRIATQIKVKKLKKYETEYVLAKEQEKNYVDPLTRLQRENKKLMEDMIRYESTITNLVLSKTAAEETAITFDEELIRTKNTLKEVEDFNSRLKEETNSVKELFQREMKQYDIESEKKSNIIADYKRTCSNLSSQLEQAQKDTRERNKFFQSNLCPACAHFVSVAINIASGGNKNPEAGAQSEQYSPSHEPSTPNTEETIKMLENELAKTKIALAEAECRNDDLSHRLSISQNELEAIRNNASGSTWLWKNLSFTKDKEHKKIGQSSSNPVSMDDCSSLSNSSNGSTGNANMNYSSGRK
ncbi:Rab GTPase-activating protein 1 [Orchesella cincta]|uniref:Rab GTPase-activating protein 1 n=1 Tax=Orchesella cincta TaxID=48709 RepID=A0A1D2NJA9_ORCCI|nr:Rab GTPase-activating protein 1 [Orchesella cincta]